MSQHSPSFQTKRLRIFAGPNGSGKTKLVNTILESRDFDLGVIINADDIHKQLKGHGNLSLDQFRMMTDQSDFDQFQRQPATASFISQTGAPAFSISDNCCIITRPDNLSYSAALIASYIRHKLCQAGQSFSFETVLSHESKLDEIKIAKQLGYRIYLYFVCLDSVDVNLRRIQNRVKLGGHDVAPVKVTERYPRVLQNLLPALLLSDRAYLFDNSKDMTLIAEFDGRRLMLRTPSTPLPDWFSSYILRRIR